ncbi:MAG: two-component system, sensor histidine kinase PdtaS [Fimbriimonadaceae bacterium]|jgi:two-component sensor histidine kinase|nr:two-component system, sensor histidine kinase PdtaS [Fimbriimonadaceae bacterium]
MPLLEAPRTAVLIRTLIAAMRHAKSDDELLGEMATLIRDHTGADSCDVLVKDFKESLVLRASTVHPESTYRLKIHKGIGLSWEAMSGKPVFISKDAEKHANFRRYPGYDMPVEGLAIVPMFNETGVAFGVVLLRKSEPWTYKSGEKKELEEIALVVGELLMAFKATFQSGKPAQKLGALSEVSKTITNSPYLEEILQLLVNITAQQFNYRVCTVRLLDESRQELVLRATQAPAKAYARKRAIHLGESIAGKAIAEMRPIIVRDVQTDPDYIGHDLAEEQGLRSMICVPLTIHNRAVGVLSCYTSDVRYFPADEIKALEALAKQAAMSIEHAKLQVRHTLMQEMHHRVKNNLQQVASLLRLQMRHGRYQSLEQALEDCISRILAIAAVHDLLSREDLDHVGLRSIAETLVQHQQGSLMLPDRQVTFEVRGDDVHLNTTQATQIALILNELLMNAIEHGFHETKAGEVHINIEERDGEVSLWVSNSGDPLPADFNPSKHSHLGLQIVESLSRALGGKFKIENRLGWAVGEVKFLRASAE